MSSEEDIESIEWDFVLPKQSEHVEEEEEITFLAKIDEDTTCSERSEDSSENQRNSEVDEQCNISPLVFLLIAGVVAGMACLLTTGSGTRGDSK